MTIKVENLVEGYDTHQLSFNEINYLLSAVGAAITGIAFNAGYYAYNKKRKREPDEVDESITDASAISAELDNKA